MGCEVSEIPQGSPEWGIWSQGLRLGGGEMPFRMVERLSHRLPENKGEANEM